MCCVPLPLYFHVAAVTGPFQLMSPHVWKGSSAVSYLCTFSIGKEFLQGSDSGGPFMCVCSLTKYLEFDTDNTILRHFAEQKLHLI